MYAINKNSYLQLKCPHINPRLINRKVDEAWEFGLPLDPYDEEPPYQRLTSEQPHIPVGDVDPTRRPVAFGAWALPLLRRELHHKDSFVVVQALTSICDLVHDPERGYEAVKLRIPDRIADLLLDILAPIRERAALALSTIAGLYDGKKAIVQNKEILNNLALGTGDAQMSVRLKVADCLEMVARSWMTADNLVENDFIQLLLERVVKESEEITRIHLETLSLLMYGCGKDIALANNGLKVFSGFMDHDNTDIISKALDCLMLLTSTKKGKKMALEVNLLRDLNKILLLHYSNVKVCTSVVSAMMFCTVKTTAKHRAAEIPNLPKRLVHLAKNPLNKDLQMYCLKTLANICEHPKIRQYVRKDLYCDIIQLQVGENGVYKDTLLKIINWQPEVLE